MHTWHTKYAIYTELNPVTFLPLPRLTCPVRVSGLMPLCVFDSDPFLLKVLSNYSKHRINIVGSVWATYRSIQLSLINTDCSTYIAFLNNSEVKWFIMHGDYLILVVGFYISLLTSPVILWGSDGVFIVDNTSKKSYCWLYRRYNLEDLTIKGLHTFS